MTNDGGADIRRRRSNDDAEERHRKLMCSALRLLVECVDAADEQCRGLLSYHSSRRLARSRMKRCQCSNNSSTVDQLQSAVSFEFQASNV